MKSKLTWVLVIIGFLLQIVTPLLKLGSAYSTFGLPTELLLVYSGTLLTAFGVLNVYFVSFRSKAMEYDKE